MDQDFEGAVEDLKRDELGSEDEDEKEDGDEQLEKQMGEVGEDEEVRNGGRGSFMLCGGCDVVYMD